MTTERMLDTAAGLAVILGRGYWRQQIEAVRRGEPNALEGILRKKLDEPLAGQLISIIRRSKRATRGNPGGARARIVGKRQQQRREEHKKAAEAFRQRLPSFIEACEAQIRTQAAKCSPTPEHFCGPLPRH